MKDILLYLRTVYQICNQKNKYLQCPNFQLPNGIWLKSNILNTYYNLTSYVQNMPFSKISIFITELS